MYGIQFQGSVSKYCYSSSKCKRCLPLSQQKQVQDPDGIHLCMSTNEDQRQFGFLQRMNLEKKSMKARTNRI